MLQKISRLLTRAWWNNADNLAPVREAMDRAANDIDRHRAYAHGIIDQAMETGVITPEEMIAAKQEWDERHA